MKNCDLGLENVSRPRSQFLTIRTSQPANNMYVFQFAGLDFDVHMSIFVSPIVFPLAFSINGELHEMFFIILLIMCL